MYSNTHDPIYSADYYSILETYFTLDVYKHTGLSIKDFLSLTEYEYTAIRQMIENKLKYLEDIYDGINKNSDLPDLDNLTGDLI